MGFRSGRVYLCDVERGCVAVPNSYYVDMGGVVSLFSGSGSGVSVAGFAFSLLGLGMNTTCLSYYCETSLIIKTSDSWK